MTEIYFIEDKSQNFSTEQLSTLAYKFVRQQAFLKTGICCEVAKTESGKPYFKDLLNLHFSISHTKNALAVAFSSSPIGIDAELLREVNLKASKKFCSPEEQKYIGTSLKRFFEIWTKKEAFIKLKGLKLKDIKEAKTDFAYSFDVDNYTVSVCGKDADNYSLFKTDCKTLVKNLEKFPEI